MLSYTTVQTIFQMLRMFFDILILWILLYYTIKIVRNNSRTAQIFKGIVLILIIRAIANFFGFKAVDWLAGVLVTYGFLAIIIIFQPEIRSVLERLGKSSVFSRLNTLSSNERLKLVDEIVTATMNLSNNRIGALITLEQGHSLSDFIKTGTPMNSLVTSDLLQTIFVPTTPLHDGAVIIQGDRIACASAYFPPTNLEAPSRYGARHRAAMGISEITDSVTVVVSEKSGRISIAEEGKLTQMTQATLRAYLEKIVLQDEFDLSDESSNKKVKDETLPIVPFKEEIVKENDKTARSELKSLLHTWIKKKEKSVKTKPVVKAVEFKDAKQIIKEEKSEVVSSMETQTELELGVVKSEETKRLPEVKVKTRFVERIKNLKPAQKPIVKDVEVKTEKRVDVETRLESRHISLEYSVSDDHLLDDEEVKQGGQGE
mgnify:CR=1 FL=1